MKRTVLALLFALAFAPVAHAADRSAAQLFKRGVGLFKAGKVEAACKAFEESDKLDDQPGTLFNMAACHEKQRRYFAAHQEFARLAARMQAAGKADKAAIAKRRADKAAVHAPRLELVLSRSNNVTRISLDGQALPAESWKQPVLVNAGSHQLSFSAEGKRTVTASATAGSDSTTRVPVPVLSGAVPQKQEPASPPAKHSPAPEEAPTQVAAPAMQPPGARDQGTTSSWTGQKTLGVALAGVGVVGVGLGSYSGLHALSQKSDADSACGDPGGGCASATQTRDAKARIHSAQTSATISTVAFAAGGVALAAGAYLFFTGGRSTAGPVARRGVHLVPAGPGDAGVSVVGAF